MENLLLILNLNDLVVLGMLSTLQENLTEQLNTDALKAELKDR